MNLVKARKSGRDQLHRRDKLTQGSRHRLRSLRNNTCWSYNSLERKGQSLHGPEWTSRLDADRSNLLRVARTFADAVPPVDREPVPSSGQQRPKSGFPRARAHGYPKRSLPSPTAKTRLLSPSQAISLIRPPIAFLPSATPHEPFAGSDRAWADVHFDLEDLFASCSVPDPDVAGSVAARDIVARRGPGSNGGRLGMLGVSDGLRRSLASSISECHRFQGSSKRTSRTLRMKMLLPEA